MEILEHPTYTTSQKLINKTQKQIIIESCKTRQNISWGFLDRLIQEYEDDYPPRNEIAVNHFHWEVFFSIIHELLSDRNYRRRLTHEDRQKVMRLVRTIEKKHPNNYGAMILEFKKRFERGLYLVSPFRDAVGDNIRNAAHTAVCFLSAFD